MNGLDTLGLKTRISMLPLLGVVASGCVGDRCIGDCEPAAMSGTDSQGVTGTTDTEVDDSGSSTSGGIEVGPPNVWPDGVLLDMPEGLGGSQIPVADFNDDGRVEGLFLGRVSSMTTTRRYVQFSIREDLGGVDRYDQASSEFESVVELFAMRNRGGGNIHAARVERGSGTPNRVGLGIIFQGWYDESFFPIDGEPLFEAISDFDDDGWSESAWLVGGMLRLFEANAEPSFSEVARFGVACQDASDLWIDFGDLDADGDGDAVVVEDCGGEATMTLWTNEDGVFVEADATVLDCGDPRSCLADIDNDGGLDLISECAEDTLHVLRGDGAGGVAEGLLFDTPRHLRGPECGDFDGDGDLEPLVMGAIAEEGSEPSGAVLLTVVDGELVEEIEEEWFDVYSVADLNGDGCDDLSGLARRGDAVVSLAFRITVCE